MLEKCVLTILELDWNQRLGHKKTKLKTCQYIYIVSGSVFFVEFDTLDLEIFVICWVESVGPTDDMCLTNQIYLFIVCLLYTSPSPRDA